MAIDQKLINRINELARKKKSVGLTDKELVEQQKLRKIYLAEFRKGFTSQLENIKVVDKEGNDVTPKKIKNMKLKH